MKGKEALIINGEEDFCQLMLFYLRKKNYKVCYALNITEGLKLIDLKRPELILADPDLSPNTEDRLNDKINSINNYTPTVLFINPNSPSKLELPDNDRTLGDEIKDLIGWIINRFKK